MVRFYPAVNCLVCAPDGWDSRWYVGLSLSPNTRERTGCGIQTGYAGLLCCTRELGDTISRFLYGRESKIYVHYIRTHGRSVPKARRPATISIKQGGINRVESTGRTQTGRSSAVENGTLHRGDGTKRKAIILEEAHHLQAAPPNLATGLTPPGRWANRFARSRVLRSLTPPLSH